MHGQTLHVRYEGSCLTQVKQLPSYRTRSATLPLTEPLPTTTTGHYTICCKNLSLTLLKMGKNCSKHVELILEISNLLLLHLVGFSTLLYHITFISYVILNTVFHRYKNSLDK